MKITKLTPLLLASTLVPLVPSLAQTPVLASPAATEETFDLNFPGGPVEALVLNLREKLNDGFPNIVIPEAAAHVHVPRMTLRGVTISDLTAVLNEIGRNGNDHEQFALTRTSDNVWTVIAPKANHTPEQQQALFLPVSKHIEAHSIDDISTTIATAWEMLDLPGDASSHLKFHQDTKLLIASGTPQMLDVISNALEALAAEAQSELEKKLESQLSTAREQLRKMETDAKLSAQIGQERSMAIQDDLRKNIAELQKENAELRAQLRDLESALARANRAK